MPLSRACQWNADWNSAPLSVWLRQIAAPRRFDPGPATRIADAPAGHPLTLSIIGRHMREHPGWTLNDYVESMAALSLEGGLRDAFTLSDRALPPESRRLLRLLTLHPGDTFDVHVASALANRAARSVRRLLDTLLAAHLLERTGRGNYRLHDLVRAYAAERLGVDEPASGCRSALERLIDHSNLRLVS